MRAMIAGDGFAALPRRPFADRRRAVGGATWDEIPYAVFVLHRADEAREPRG